VKKIYVMFMAAVLLTGLSAFVFAQEESGKPELKISGEAKSGIEWRQSQDEGKPPVSDPKRPSDPAVRLYNRDDAGDQGNRVRINMDYDNGNGFGVRFRIQWDNFNVAEVPWSYAFGYGNFFDNQLTVSVGKLGASPWGTGGDLWKQLETALYGGVRVEWKPAFIPVGHLNVGFVLNQVDDINEASNQLSPTIWDLLQESVVGISYTHDLFHFRFAYRFDSILDNIGGRFGLEGEKEGGKIIYRLEEYALRRAAPGLSMWAVGYLIGVGASFPEFYDYKNQFFTEYSPPELFGLQTPFTAQIRLGYDYVETRQILHIRPLLYWNFFDKLFTVGAYFLYGLDFGNRVWEDAPYLYIEVEPKIQLNFSSSYISLVYNWRQEYISDYPERRNADPIRRTQFINLRFCIYF